MPFLAMFMGIPNWVKAALVAGVVLGAVEVKHIWQVRGLNNTITTLQQQVDQQKAANADLQVAVMNQNKAIEVMKADARKHEANAIARALRSITTGSGVSKDLLRPDGPVGSGPVPMNKWLEDTFIPKGGM